MRTIALITDFGTRDHYVGSIKGAILTVAPQARIVDISHDIERHSVAHGALVLQQCWRSFPEETIFLAVVDPGVGSSRRMIVARFADRYVVAPDNGLVSFVHGEWPSQGIHVLECRSYFLNDASPTFHGRDVMAPVAAHLASGVDMAAFGPSVGEVELLPVKLSGEIIGQAIHGVVVYVDAFGTLVTNIRAAQIDGLDTPQDRISVSINGRKIGPVRRTYSDVPVGECIALVGGSGLLEIAVNQGRADERLGLGGIASAVVVDLA